MNEDLKFKNYSIKELLLGKFSKAFLLKRWYATFVPTFFMLLFISYIIYPQNYSIFLDSISFLGDYIENPNGWWAFFIAMFVGAFMLFPVVLYFHRRLVKICPYFARFTTFIGLICSSGMILVAIIADSNIDMWGINMSKIHGTISGIVFGGLAVVIIFYGFIYLKDALTYKHVNWKLNFIPYAIFLFGALGMGISQLVKEQMGLGWPKPDWPLEYKLLGFPFWEWTALICCWIFYILNAMILPEKIEK